MSGMCNPVETDEHNVKTLRLTTASHSVNYFAPLDASTEKYILDMESLKFQ